MQQSTKSPGFHQNHAPLPSTSTLARLLTAPERSFQGAPKLSQGQLPPRQSTNKVHNNGEITITPISHNNSRNKDFSMVKCENYVNYEKYLKYFSCFNCRTMKTTLWKSRRWWLTKLKTLRQPNVATWSQCRTFCVKDARRIKHFSCVLGKQI